LVDVAREVLEAPGDESRRLRLEGLAREIDAAFDPASMPDELVSIRAQIIAELQ
jgi:hypothetical protein